MKTIMNQGHYELFETSNGNQILVFNNEEWYALVEGEKGDIIVHSDSDHEKKKTLQEGKFYLADFEDDPDFRDMPHLLLQREDEYQEFILPNGLPTQGDHQKKLIRSDKPVSVDKVKEHVEG
jgi:hypothetical protein